MKKTLAILLALLLVCLPAAVAESAVNNAGMLRLYDIEVMGNSLGELEVWAGIEAAEAPLFTANAAVGEDVLASVVGEFVGDEIRASFSNDENAYAAKLSELAQGMPPQVAAALPQLPELLKQLIPALDQLVLPMVPGIPIPQLDLAAMLAGDADSIELTTEQIDSLLGIGETYINNFGSQIPQADQILEVISQLKGKLSVNCAFSEDGAAKVARADIFFDGQQDGTLVLTSEENRARLTLEIDGTEQGGLTATSDPDAAAIDVDVDVAGNVMGGFSIYQEDGLQKIVFEINAEEKIAMELDYGTQNGRDIVSLVMDAGSQGGLDFLADTAIGDEGVRTGTVSFNGDFGGSNASFSAGVDMAMIESLELGEITWPETLQSFGELNLSAVLQPVQDYIQSIAQDAAA